MDQINKEEYNILYVDDEKSNLSSFKNLFRRKFNIITASSGQEGLEILAAQPIHAIITDQRMPNMTGIDFLIKAKDNWPDLKYILLTAYNDNEVIKDAINKTGIFWYVNKPFDPDQMEQIITNATNAYRADNKLKESEAKFRGVFESMTDVFTRSDMNGKCVLVSPSIYKMIGYKPEEIIGKDLADFYADPKQRTEIVNELKSSRDVINYEFDIVRKDGKTITVSADTKMYYNSDGQPLGVEGNIRDITKQKFSEKEILMYQQRLKDLAQDLTVSEEKVRKQIAVDLHDHVGQMLASIRMQMTRIADMEENPDLNAKLKNISQALLKAIEATRAAIFDLSPPQLNEIGLFAAVHDWAKDQIERKHGLITSIKTGEQEKFPLEENTRFLVFRSVKEIILNVVKHARANQLKVDFDGNRDVLEIKIEDDGIGFNYNPDLLRLKSHSYGLFSVEERMSDLEGSMTIDSVIDQGTIVKLSLPLKDKK